MDDKTAQHGFDLSDTRSCRLQRERNQTCGGNLEVSGCGTHEEHDLSRLLINDNVPPRLEQRGSSELDRQARTDGSESDCDEAVDKVLDL